MDHEEPNQEPKIECNGSLDIPTFGKASFWGVVGIPFLFIGFLFLMLYIIFNLFSVNSIFNSVAFLIGSIIWFLFWSIITIQSNKILLVPRTIVKQDGLYIRRLFLRKKEFYKWDKFNKYAINRSLLDATLSRTNRNFLYLNLKSGKLIKIGLGQRDPGAIRNFFQTSTDIPELNVSKQYKCAYHENNIIEYLCDKCGALICKSCLETRSYRHLLHQYAISSLELSCQSCFYNQFFNISKFSMIFGIIFFIFLAFLPFSGRSYC